MRTLITDARFRAATLNGTLVLLFLCAWVSDVRPEFALAAVLAAGGIVVVEVLLLVLVARARNEVRDCPVGSRHERAPTRVEEPALVVQPISYEDQVRRAGQLLAARKALAMSELEIAAVKSALTAQRQRLDDLAPLYRRHVARRAHASDVSSWYLAAGHYPMTDSVVVGGVGRRKLGAAPTALQEWKLHSYGCDVFDIDAGAFVLEHNDGKTSILIRNPDRVSVENSPELGAFASETDCDESVPRHVRAVA